MPKHASLQLLVVFISGALVIAAPSRDAKDAAAREAVSALELSGQLSTFYANFTGIIEVTLGRLSSGVTDPASLRVLTLAKLRLARACRAVAFQLDPRNGLIDTWTLCVQFRAYAAGDAPARDLGISPQALPVLRDATLRLERDIVLIAGAYLSQAHLFEVSAEIEAFCKAHPLSSAHAVTPPPSISGNSKGLGVGLGKLLSLPLAPFHAMEGVDHTAQSVAEFARVVDAVDRTVSNLPMETAWETELLLLDLRRDLSTLLEEKTGALNSALNNTLAAALAKTNATLRAAINLAALRALQVAGAIFALCLAYHFLTRRWFPRQT